MRARPPTGGLLVAAILFCACSDVRERPPGTGLHPDGWAAPGSSEFHGVWLSDNGYPLNECRACHGQDDRGGDVNRSCETAGCHSSGVNACGTCHGTFASNALPNSGAHASHVGLCEACHTVPSRVDMAGHLDGTIDVVFSGLALANNATPTWNASQGSCSASYCHDGATVSWREPAVLGCAGCHGDPPASHAPFARTAGACTSCHPAATASTHVNGSVELITSRCDTCHGENNRSSPPLALDGSTASTDRGVGAHARHLDETLFGRIGKPARCDQCHVVPASITSAGHLDPSPGAEVRLPLGSAYASANQTCNVWCHWNRDPGPRWTDDSGAARACDSCHDFPLSVTRAGTPHPSSPAGVTVEACLGCHLYTPQTHVNGTVDFVF